MTIAGHCRDNVYAVRSLEEARQIIAALDKNTLSEILSRLFVWSIVFFANLCLGLLKYILFSSRGIPDKNFQNIVIYTVGIVGDNVVLLPALAAIRQRYQEAQITVISNCQIWDENGAKEVLGPSRFKDRLIIIKDYPVDRKGFKLVYNRHLFADLQCDLFVNLSPFGNRGWIGAVIKELLFAYKLGATHAVGFRIASYSRKNWFNAIKHYFVQNEPRRSRRVLKELNLEPIENVDLFEHDAAAKESVIKKLRAQGWQNEPLFVINPGAKFMSKCWPAERFGQIAKHISESYGGLSVITGISAEKAIADNVAKQAGVKVINLAGLTSIQEVVEMLRMAKACITNDTGIMHIAAMIGVPTVAIFSTRHSPTDWFPLGKHIISLFTLPQCRYCYNDDCPDPICIQSISVDDVIKNISHFVF
ncbi:MAG TPA: glycosyltransferase family 9 protein [Smithellaceae bacterium]|nr:glycosyltransferase family 9 protein [Smithellaceae bacterium]